MKSSIQTIQNISPESNWLTEKEVAVMIGVTPATLQNWIWRSVGIPYAKFLRNVRYSESDVLEYMRSHTVEVEPV